MEKNTWLNIYQAYSLEKISALNKRGLAMQYAQCEQLVKLNEEVAATNEATRRILQNQIREIEKREEQKYYKSLAFNLNLALQSLEEQDDIHFKTFLCSIFLSGINSFAKQALTSLDEISDKEYVQSLIARIKVLEQVILGNKELYRTSIWANYASLSKENLIENEQYERERESKELEIKQIEENYKKNVDKFNSEKKLYTGCSSIIAFIGGIFILALIVAICNKDYEVIEGGIILTSITFILYFLTEWGIKKADQKANNVEKDNDRILILEDEITKISNKNLDINRTHNEILQSINLEYPNWEGEVQKIIGFLPSEN